MDERRAAAGPIFWCIAKHPKRQILCLIFGVFSEKVEVYYRLLGKTGSGCLSAKDSRDAFQAGSEGFFRTGEIQAHMTIALLAKDRTGV